MTSKRARRHHRKQVAARSAQARANRVQRMAQGNLDHSLHWSSLSSLNASELDTVLGALEQEASQRQQSAKQQLAQIPSQVIQPHRPPHSISHDTRYLASRPLTPDGDIAAMAPRQARLARRRNRRILDAKAKVASVDRGQWVVVRAGGTSYPQGRGVGEPTPRARALGDEISAAQHFIKGLRIVRQRLMAGVTDLVTAVRQAKDFAKSLGHRIIGEQSSTAATRERVRKPSKRQRKHARQLDKAMADYSVPGMTRNQYQALMRAFELLGGPDLVAWWQHLTPHEREYLYRDTNMANDFFRAIDSPSRGRLQDGQAPWQAMTRRGSDWLVDAIIQSYREEVAYAPREAKSAS